MKLPLRWFLLATAGAVLAGRTAWAQIRLREFEEPRLITMRVDQAYTGLYVEAYERTTSSAGAGADLKETRLFVGPLIGLSLGGSIYHPNLLAYRVTLDGSYGWSDEEYSGAANAPSQKETRFLGSFFGEMNWLANKPLHGRLFANYTHTYQDYDFFNRIYVDNWRYGGDVAFTQGPFLFFATVYLDSSDGSANSIPTTSESTVATASLTHSREHGSTSIGGSINDFTRNDFGVASSGSDYSLSLADAENFGSRRQIHAQVNGNLNHFEAFSTPTDLYSLSANLRVEHSDRLGSDYNASYSRTTTGLAENDSVTGGASVRHQLFDSLVSTLNLQGYEYSAQSGATRQDSWQFGGGPTFDYTKKLSASSVLSAQESFALFHTEVTSSGGLVPVIDEPHFFNASPGGDTFSLRQPYVVTSSIIITDTSRLPPGGFLEGLDYIVIPNGAITLIRRPPGSRMPDAVLVSYDFASSPAGSYDTLRNNCGVRVDFFNNRLGIYTRLNLDRSQGAQEFAVQDLNDWITGVEGNWRAWRAGVEYELYDSSLSPFSALRFFQSLTFQPAEASTLSLNFTESFLEYDQAGRSEQNYTATLRFNRRLSRRLGFNLDLGASQRTGDGVDQTLAIFRPQLQYVAGKLSATIGYDYSYDEYLNTQTRVRNLGFLRVRRDF